MTGVLLQAVQREKGFTLIEVVAVLLLVVILAVVGLEGFTGAVRGYLFAREGVATAQKAQMAITRLGKELLVISKVNSSSATALNFSSYKLGVEGSHSVTVSGSQLLLDGDPLTDQVRSFSLAWYDSYTDTTPEAIWASGQRMVQITLTLNGPDNIAATFTKMIRPRNLGG